MLAVAARVAKLGFDVAVAAPRSGPLAGELLACGVRHIPLISRVVDASRPIEERRAELCSLLTLEGPDLLHANSLIMGRLSGPVAMELRIPSLSHLRDIMRVNRAVGRDLCCHRRLLAVSQAVKSWYSGLGFPENQIRVIRNGVDLKKFQPRPSSGFLTSELRLPPSSLLVLCIGQFILRKGFDVLLDAAEIVVSQRNSVHFAIVGARFSDKPETVEYERTLLRRANEAPLRGRVHFLGVRSDVDRLLTEVSLLVHPARQEPLGRVLLEAAASGVPVVATRVGGTEEVFPDSSGAALLVPAGDSAGLASAMRIVADDESLRRRMSAAARAIAESRFDAEQAAVALADQYREVLSGT
jgi:glycosyltransferase involved in cell wall biosynthesis